MTPGLVQFASGAIIFPEATIKPSVEVHDAIDIRPTVDTPAVDVHDSIDIAPTIEVSGEWSP
jgi:hypothetical protein